MRSVVGVFKSRSDALQGAREVEHAGIPESAVTLLTPDLAERPAPVPKADAEQPGMVKAMGAVAGGALGLGVGEGLASLIVPGVGPVLAVGLIGGAILGALAGAAVGSAGENAVFSGVPGDELFIYKDALRQNRTVLIVMTNDSAEAERVRVLIERSGAESVDSARQMWWLGLRNVEKEHYNAAGGNFDRDEADFRRGFEAALQNGHERETRERQPDTWNSEAYRQGFERGRWYAKSAEKQSTRT